MAKKAFTAGQLIPTSSTPPSNAGFYRIDKNTIGVVGNLVQKNAQTNTESNVASGANLAAELAAVKSPVTLFQCGLPFCLFAGDGGSNGMLFSGTAGAFTLSAAALAGMTVTNGYCYLAATSAPGGVAGWFYFTMSDDTTGVVYNNIYDPASGVAPTIPAAPTAFANWAGGRILQKTIELTALQIPIAGGAMGNNGMIGVHFKLLGSATAGTKRVYVRDAGVITAVYNLTTSPIFEGRVVSQNAGRQDRQSCTRNYTAIGSPAVSTINGDFSSIDTSVNHSLTVSMQVTATTETNVLYVRDVFLKAG